jgi:cell wall-associated NlpC family hydrolase
MQRPQPGKRIENDWRHDALMALSTKSTTQSAIHETPGTHFRIPSYSRRGVAFSTARRTLCLGAISLALGGCVAQDVSSHVTPTISIFPLDRYQQNVDAWLPKSSPSYDRPVLDSTTQNLRFRDLLARYFGTSDLDQSPWNLVYIGDRLGSDRPDNVGEIQRQLVAGLATGSATGSSPPYGENFREYPTNWVAEIAKNSDLAQFDEATSADPHKRAIAIKEALVRVLPTEDPAFGDVRIPGQGYPFDNFQQSALRPGTPLYIAGVSHDRVWKLVISPSVVGWVKDDALARVDDAFIDAWQTAAKKNLGAWVGEPASVLDSDGTSRFVARIGTVLPIEGQTPAGRVVLVPTRGTNGNATIHRAAVDSARIESMPLAATPRNFAVLLKGMVGQPYGWGNSYFYNDCSAELRSLLMPFGIWLPRHSSAQAAMGNRVNLSALNTDERLSYLVKHGHPLLTLIHINGHVMLYIGNVSFDGKVVPMIYQNIWGLRPADNSRRSIIGQSVFLPLLTDYPEDRSLQSLASKTLFELTFLDDADVDFRRR